MTASTAGRKQAMQAIVVLAALVVMASIVLLIADFVAARSRAPSDEARIAELEERTRSDADAAAELEAERERQTERSLAREAVNRRLGWLLLAASAVFLTGAKWLMARNERPLATFRWQPPGMWRPAVSMDEDPSLDLRPSDSATTEVDLAFVDGLVKRLGSGREAAIPILQAIETHYRYLPEEALRRVAERTEITPAQIAGTASFYAQFRRTPVGEHLVRVCHGTACHVAGVEHVDRELRRRLAIPEGADTDPSLRFTLDPVACLGCCSLAPVMMVGDDTAGRLTPASAWEALRRYFTRGAAT